MKQTSKKHVLPTHKSLQALPIKGSKFQQQSILKVGSSMG